MKTIEEIKIELTLKNLAGELERGDIINIPLCEELREFVNSLGPIYGSMYSFRLSIHRSILSSKNFRMNH